MVTFHVDMTAPRTAFPHYWETCVGSCHAPTALREDWRTQLKQAHAELGFRYVRCHGLLDDCMSVCLRNRDGSLSYNFALIDSIYDFLLSIGMKPFVELSFMPSALGSTQKTLFVYNGNISIPASYDEWDELIRRLLVHLTERYGADEVRTWFFEVWNEPNLAFFYEGTQETYFELYAHTARVIKSVDAQYQVGGPATAINAWVTDTIQYCEKNGVPLDFISTHHYPTDDPLWNTGMSIEAYFKEIEAGKRKVEKHNAYRRGVLTTMLERTKEESGDYPLFYTEWNTSSSDVDMRHDVPYSAAFVAKTLIDNSGMADVYSFWTFSDIFEENGQRPGEFHGGFGLVTLHDIPKPVYHAFRMMHALGDERLQTTAEQGTVGIVATEHGGKDGGRLSVRVVAYNHDIFEHPPEAQDVVLRLDGKYINSATITRVDDAHGNPYANFVAMGSPEYLTPTQVDMLIAESAPVAETLPATMNEVRFTLPANGVVLIELNV